MTVYFIQGHVPFWGHSLQPCLVDTSGKITKALMANMISKISRGNVKVRIRGTTPATIGMNQSGTITGICFLNLSSKHSTVSLSRNLAAMCPYPQGHDRVLKYLQYGQTKTMIQTEPAMPYARYATAEIQPPPSRRNWQ